MKKMTFLACAAMLASAVAFTGCKGNQNDPQQKVPQVTTDIALSLPGQVGNNGARRMPGQTVQTGGYSDFTANGGIQSMILVPFAPKAKVTTASVRHGDNITLEAFNTATAYSQSADGRAKLYENKQVPAGTSAFLFYGVSAASGSKFNVGSLAFGNQDDEPSDFVFELEPINQSVATTIEVDAAYTGLIAYLNHVANATDGSKAWKNYVFADNEGFYELFQVYSTVTVLSSFGIERMMDDLYQNLKLNTTDALASAIRDSIAKADSPYARLDGEGHVKLESALTGFPSKFNLPDGAVAVAYNAGEGKFGGNAAHAYGSLAPAQLDRYVYPAQLWYFSNTQIKTSETSKASSYTSPASWKAILATYEKDNSSVNAKTRSIALKDTIQYAVARLDVQIQIKGTTSLKDNNPVTAAQDVPNPLTGYPVSAILVGGQKNVGFDFTPTTYSGDKTNALTIYDNVMTNSIAAAQGGYSAFNSTLVLESAANEDQYIAVELTNNSGQDFYGADGLVPKGGKFYLVGKLTASEATETESKVYKQDYTTIARLSIADLTKAFNTIPDLKAPQLEIGLSVDLSWSAGHTYTIDL